MSEILLAGAAAADGDTGPEITPPGEGRMVREDCWRQVHRLFHVERRSKAEIARQVGLDRKTVRGILQGAAWQPYTRAGRADTLLTEHLTYLQGRAPQVQYSARILFQELPAEVIRKPLVYDKEKWSGEKMILIPSLIDDSLDRGEIVEMFAKPRTGAKFGTVALCPSFKGTQDWRQYGADVADTRSIEEKIGKLKDGDFKNTLVVVNRYDGIDLPDSACRILVMDSRPYSESVLDRFMERCLGNSESISVKTARKIEQGLGRSVRGEKDYCAIILTGPELIKQIRTAASRRFLSAQTRTQIEIGLEIADDAKAEGKDPKSSLVALINQCLRRDDGWKTFYVERMDSMEDKGLHHQRLEIFALELRAEQKAEEGFFEEAAAIVQDLSDRHVTDEAERGWYLQEMARLAYRSSKAKSNTYQIAAHQKNRYLLKPREGLVVEKISPLSQKRVDNIIDSIKRFKVYEDLALAVDEIVSKLAFTRPPWKAIGIRVRAPGCGVERGSRQSVVSP
jgi:hypothetical protein